MSSLSHIFKRREPGIAFVSPWRKVSVLPVIQNNSAVHELIRTKFCSWKLGCGAPWRAITRAEGLTGEGPGVGGWGKRKEMTRFRGSAFFFAPLYTHQRPPCTESPGLRCSFLATLPPMETRGWLSARRAFAPAPSQQKAHVCALYSRKLQSGPWPGDLFIMSKIKAVAMSGTLPSPPFSRNHLLNQACITVHRAFQTKVWWSFVNITR